MNLILIYAEFFKVGLFAVGGGLATLPFLFRMADGHFTFIILRDWLDQQMIGNFIAIAQSSPGAIGVNMAAQIGFHYSGIAGAIITPLGLTSPAIIIIMIIARMLQSFKENRIVNSVFSGLRPAAGGLLAAAGFSIWKLSLYNAEGLGWHEILRWKECLIFAVFFFLIYKLKGNPIIYIAAGAAAGIIFRF